MSFFDLIAAIDIKDFDMFDKRSTSLLHRAHDISDRNIVFKERD